jgi:hypothetical protein
VLDFCFSKPIQKKNKFKGHHLPQAVPKEVTTAIFIFSFGKPTAGGLATWNLLPSCSAASEGGEPQSALTVGSADECGGG